MDDLPVPVDPPINLCTIPAKSDLFFSTRLFGSIDKVKSQDGDIPVPLDLRVNHVVMVDVDLTRQGN